MVKPEPMHPEDALIKIQTLTSAAAFLTENEDQISLLLSLMDVIAETAKRGLEYDRK
ncbi:hypothetical protein G3M83_07140 [Rouxiella badensis]|uniref:hypothetical protein n=1 Tax=Rouxiella badensis TaxID=1646377 RepID=UPI0013EF471A|nr:hypothetical protein [Rouxiella badensis]QII36180.1 hypothetical protein G3M83_07140 [Rouxiella badensis]